MKILLQRFLFHMLLDHSQLWSTGSRHVAFIFTAPHWELLEKSSLELTTMTQTKYFIFFLSQRKWGKPDLFFNFFFGCECPEKTLGPGGGGRTSKFGKAILECFPGSMSQNLLCMNYRRPGYTEIFTAHTDCWEAVRWGASGTLQLDALFRIILCSMFAS